MFTPQEATLLYNLLLADIRRIEQIAEADPSSQEFIRIKLAERRQLAANLRSLALKVSLDEFRKECVALRSSQTSAA